MWQLADTLSYMATASSDPTFLVPRDRGCHTDIIQCKQRLGAAAAEGDSDVHTVLSKQVTSTKYFARGELVNMIMASATPQQQWERLTDLYKAEHGGSSPPPDLCNGSAGPSYPLPAAPPGRRWAAGAPRDHQSADWVPVLIDV